MPDPLPPYRHHPSRPPTGTPPRRGQRTGWEVLGVALAILLAICGLVIVGVFVFFAVGMAQFGSNK